jgi:excisionase family DNA binding protein
VKADLEHAKFCATVNLLGETQLLTVAEVADCLRQSERTVRDKIAAGLIPSVRIGDGPRAPIRVDLAALEDFLHGSSRKPPADEAADVRTAASRGGLEGDA